MRTLKAKLRNISTDDIAEFQPERVSQATPSATLDTHTVNNVHHTTEIKATGRIENEHK